MSASIWAADAFPLVNAANAIAREDFEISVPGTDTVTLTTFSYVPGNSSIELFINGLRQRSGIDFTETSNVSLSLIGAVFLTGDIVTVVGQLSLDTVSAELALQTLQDQAGSSYIGFLQSGTGAVPTTLQARLRESVSVKDFGAVGNGVIDDTAAIQLAISSLPVGGTVFIPKGTYKINGTITITANGVTVCGDGPLATNIVQHSTTVDTVIFSSTQFSGIQDLRITSSSTPSAGYAVTFNKTGATGCFYGFANNVYIQDMWNGVLIRSSAETRIDDVHLRGLLGTRGFLFDGTGSGANASYRAVLNNTVCDTAGNGNTSILWYCQDNYSYSLVLNQCTALYGGTGFAMVDSANTGTSYPMWCYADDLECDHNQTVGVNLSNGEGFYCTQSWIGSVLAGSGIAIGASYRGEVDIGNTRIMGCSQHGIIINAGPVDVMIHDNMIGDNSTSGSGTYHGIVVAANASRFYIDNNRIGDLVGVAGNNQGWGVIISAGTSTDFRVSDNNLKGNVTGGLFDGATGTAGLTESNLGYNPVGSAPLVIGASPFTYTAGHSPETIYLIGGTITTVKDGAANLLANVANTSHQLGPNEQLVITHTLAPAATKVIH